MSSGPFVTLPEAAVIACAPERTIRSWIASGRLPAFKPGKRLLIERERLLAFIKSCAA